jgi:hypothetical protein
MKSSLSVNKITKPILKVNNLLKSIKFFCLFNPNQFTSVQIVNSKFCNENESERVSETILNEIFPIPNNLSDLKSKIKKKNLKINLPEKDKTADFEKNIAQDLHKEIISVNNLGNLKYK